MKTPPPSTKNAPTTKASPARTRPKARTTSPPDPTTPPRDSAGERQVTLAVVIGAHGIGGQCRLKVFSGDLAAYRSFNGGALNATSIRGGANGTIARFAEIPDRTAAEALRGTELRVPRSALPPLAEGEYYHVDLIGLPAISSEGTVLGTVVEIENFGAGDVIEIERPPVEGRPGKRFMVPMRPDAVPHWDDDGLTVDAAYVE